MPDEVRLINSCPCCGSTDYKQQVVLTDKSMPQYREFSQKKFDGLLDGWVSDVKPEIVRCPRCAHRWYIRHPSEKNLILMYESGKRLIPKELSRNPTPRIFSEVYRLRCLVDRAHPSFLDYGSGFGRWARAASRLNFNVHAYEPSILRGSEQNSEFELVNSLDQLGDLQFDVINLEQVLEHVSDPLTVMLDLHKFCHINTIVRATVPNILNPPEGKLVWDHWPYDGKRVHAMAPYEHLHGFTPRSLTKLLKRSGYTPLPLLSIMHIYPMYFLRVFLGFFYPRLCPTMILARPSK